MTKNNNHIRKKIIFCFLSGILFSFIGVSQNWNVFNNNYRYNYVYNNNAIITNVLFADSTKIIGSDTVYFMNRIGVECSGGCPTLPTAITGTVLVINLPQFLQRKIIKYPNGLVMLKDTAKLIIKPNCILNETWLFDSINYKNAQCINISTESVFAFTDSVKTILLDGTDTLKLSKQFGIIQFPNVYNKNKYYRLGGIENKNTYEQNALFGLKVPNAWDFYDFNIGDKFCYQDFRDWGSISNNIVSKKNTNRTIEIISKTLIPNNGYSYNAIIKEEISTANNYNSNDPVIYSSSLTTVTSTLSYNTTTASIENIMYPEKAIKITSFADVTHGQGIYPTYYNIAKFGQDNYGKFYKYYGKNCITFTNNAIPPNNSVGPRSFSLYNQPYTGLLNLGSGYYISEVYGEGLGQIANIYDIRYQTYACLTCAIKNSSLYLGAEIFVGVKEKTNEINGITIYPNPTQNKLHINLNQSEIEKIELLNSTGLTILKKEITSQNTELEIKEYNSGIYFLALYNKFGLVEVKKFIKE